MSVYELRHDVTPLTLEELRSMQGQPLWVEPVHDNDSKLPGDMLPANFVPQWVILKEYAFVDSLDDEGRLHLLNPECDYLLRWKAYRCKPSTEDITDNDIADYLGISLSDAKYIHYLCVNYPGCVKAGLDLISNEVTSKFIEKVRDM